MSVLFVLCKAHWTASVSEMCQESYIAVKEAVGNLSLTKTTNQSQEESLTPFVKLYAENIELDWVRASQFAQAVIDTAKWPTAALID